MRENVLDECVQIFAFRCKLCCFLCCSLCHGQDGTFFWLHNGFVCSLDCFFHCLCKNLCIQLLIVADLLGKATKELGKNNARVTSGTAQRTGRDCLGKVVHVHFCERVYFLDCGHDRQRHVGTCVAVRYREHVQLIDPLFLYFQIFCTSQKHFCQ